MKQEDMEERPIGTLYEARPQPSTTGIDSSSCSSGYFEVKSSTFKMLKENQFYGLPHENPLEHLRTFEKICSLVTLNGASIDGLRLSLFSWTLGGKAAAWERNVPSADVKKWGDCERAFLLRFFPRERTIKFRESISHFKQGAHEELYEAWDRYREYTYQCPHHGFTKEAWLSYFHGGLTDKWRIALNLASGGNFAQISFSKGQDIVENLVTAERDFGGTSNQDLRESEAMEARLESIKAEIKDLKSMFSKFMRKIEQVDQVYENKPKELSNLDFKEMDFNHFEKLDSEENPIGSGIGCAEDKKPKGTGSRESEISNKDMYRPGTGRYEILEHSEYSDSKDESIDTKAYIDDLSVDTSCPDESNEIQAKKDLQNDPPLLFPNHHGALKTTEDAVKKMTSMFNDSMSKIESKSDELDVKCNNFSGKSPRTLKEEPGYATELRSDKASPPRKERYEKPLYENKSSWQIPFARGFLDKNAKKGGQSKEARVPNAKSGSAETEKGQGTERESLLDVDKMTYQDLAKLLIEHSKCQNGVTDRSVALKIDEILHMPFPRRYIQSLQALSQREARNKDEEEIVNGKELDSSNGKWCAQDFNGNKCPNEKEHNKEKCQEVFGEAFMPRGNAVHLHRPNALVNVDELEDSGKSYRPPVSVDTPTVSVDMPIDTDLSTKCISRYKLNELGKSFKLGTNSPIDMVEEDPNSNVKVPCPRLSKTAPSNDPPMKGEVCNENIAEVVRGTILPDEATMLSENGDIMEYKAFLYLLEKSLHGKSNIEWKYEALRGALKGMLETWYAYRFEEIPSLQIFIKHTFDDLPEVEKVFALNMPDKPRNSEPSRNNKEGDSTLRFKLEEGHTLDKRSSGCISLTPLWNDENEKEHESSNFHSFKVKNENDASNEVRRLIIPIDVHFRSPNSRSNMRPMLEKLKNELDGTEKEHGSVSPEELCNTILMSDEGNSNESGKLDEYKAYMHLLDEVLRLELFPKKEYLLLQEALEEMLTKASILEEGNNLPPLKTFLNYFMENHQEVLRALGTSKETPSKEVVSNCKLKKEPNHPPNNEMFGAHKEPSPGESHGVPSSQTMIIHHLRLIDGITEYKDSSNTHSSPITWNPRIPPSPNIPKDQG